MKKMMLTGLAVMLSSTAFAANYEVKMLNHGADGGMVFEPAFIKANVGDTVTFVPTNKGHWVQSKVVPEGAEKFLSKEDEQFELKLTHEGVYVYVCPPHRMMNMSGIIQVGTATNKEKAEKVALDIDKRAMDNKGRLKKYIEQIK
ncbi:pseudoazurin [Pelistega europaea]|uniref:Pseudoazurin n=2 Tax=Pelistega europaea TaxID=106147 RepID=A0A7Y4LAB4_9BURK|nr:pseudoazurin [Pelistega europaea]